MLEQVEKESIEISQVCKAYMFGITTKLSNGIV